MSLDASYEKAITVARNAFNSGKTRPLSFRLAQMKKFIQMIEANREEIARAANLDLKKHKLEITLYEVESLLNEARVLINHLKEYTRTEVLPFNFLGALDKGTIEKVPFGVVLVLGAWNYPFLLSFSPFLGALAAGNTVILKPSEVSGHSALLMSQMVPKYLDPECYHVVLANPEETSHLLRYKFDYIFYTGSTNIGRLIMQAAANHLTPVTLELGGKSPAFIDDNSDYEIACKRILWGRFSNCGQTCIAPDYLLCSKKVEAEFINVAKNAIKEWYEGDSQKTESYQRIINEKHCLRLKHLLDTTRGRIVVGGRVDVADLYIEPTIVVDVALDDPLMAEGEIFGPILPILTVNSVQEAIDIINSGARPLALYTFSKTPKVNQEIKNKTISGGVCINDTMWHGVWNGLPFGGVGDSGMGNYHQKCSIDTFSHHRSILERSFSGLSEKLGESRYPPYNDSKIKMMTFIIRHFLKFDVNPGSLFTHLLAFCVGAAIIAIIAWAR